MLVYIAMGNHIAVPRFIHEDEERLNACMAVSQVSDFRGTGSASTTHFQCFVTGGRKMVHTSTGGAVGSSLLCLLVEFSDTIRDVLSPGGVFFP